MPKPFTLVCYHNTNLICRCAPPHLINCPNKPEPNLPHTVPWGTAYILVHEPTKLYWSVAEAWTQGGHIPRVYQTESHAKYGAIHHAAGFCKLEEISILPVTIQIKSPPRPWWQAVKDFLTNA